MTPTYRTTLAALADLGGTVLSARFSHDDHTWVRLDGYTVCVSHDLAPDGHLLVNIGTGGASFAHRADAAATVDLAVARYA